MSGFAFRIIMSCVCVLYGGSVVERGQRGLFENTVYEKEALKMSINYIK